MNKTPCVKARTINGQTADVFTEDAAAAVARLTHHELAHFLGLLAGHIKTESDAILKSDRKVSDALYRAFMAVREGGDEIGLAERAKEERS